MTLMSAEGAERGPPSTQVLSLSRVQLFVTPWTVACQDSPSLGFSRQEHWSGLLFPSPGEETKTQTGRGCPK